MKYEIIFKVSVIILVIVVLYLLITTVVYCIAGLFALWQLIMLAVLSA